MFQDREYHISDLEKIDFYKEDNRGNIFLHELCHNRNLTPELLKFAHRKYSKLFHMKNMYDVSPIHKLCNNKLTVEMLEIVYHEDFWADDSIFMVLCRNEDIRSDQYTKIMKFLYFKNPSCFKYMNKFWLCLNKLITLDILKIISDDLFEKNNFGNTLIHWLTQNQNLTTEIIEYIYEKNPKVFRIKNCVGISVFNWLCNDNNHSFIKFAIFTFSLRKDEESIDEDYLKYQRGELKIDQNNFKYLSKKN